MDAAKDKARTDRQRVAKVRKQLCDAVLSQASRGADASDESILTLAHAYRVLAEHGGSDAELLAEAQAAIVDAIGGRLPGTKDEPADLHTLARALCLVS